MKNETINRRQLLKQTLLVGGAMPLFKALAGEPTPQQTSGPFYPDFNNDLTRLVGSNKVAKGDIVDVSGTILDEEDKPIEGALVEIWQADAQGRYNHAGDPQTHLIPDPNFQFFGKMVTQSDGRYQFRTIVPGKYPIGGGQVRTPHIHYRVVRRTYRELITQLYFTKFDSLNKNDIVLVGTPKKDWPKLVVDFKESAITLGGISRTLHTGTFDLTLERL